MIILSVANMVSKSSWKNIFIQNYDFCSNHGITTVEFSALTYISRFLRYDDNVDLSAVISDCQFNELLLYLSW